MEYVKSNDLAIISNQNSYVHIFRLGINDDRGSGNTFDNQSVGPEPTTIISGALMLLPFGAGTLRILRRNRGG